MEAKRYRDLANLDDNDIEEVAAEAKASGKPVAKADFKRRADAKRKRDAPTSVIPPKPEQLVSLSLWLRRGAKIIPQFTDHRDV